MILKYFVLCSWPLQVVVGINFKYEDVVCCKSSFLSSIWFSLLPYHVVSLHWWLDLLFLSPRLDIGNMALCFLSQCTEIGSYVILHFNITSRVFSQKRYYALIVIKLCYFWVCIDAWWHCYQSWCEKKRVYRIEEWHGDFRFYFLGSVISMNSCKNSVLLMIFDEAW